MRARFAAVAVTGLVLLSVGLAMLFLPSGAGRRCLMEVGPIGAAPTLIPTPDPACVPRSELETTAAGILVVGLIAGGGSLLFAGATGVVLHRSERRP